MEPPTTYQTLEGSKWDFRLVVKLHTNRSRFMVFKAEILQKRSGEPVPAKWAIVKTTSPDRKHYLTAEYAAYSKPSIAECPYIRKLYDVIGDPKDLENGTGAPVPCLAFEWLDFGLRQLWTNSSEKGHLFRGLWRAALHCSKAMAEADMVNLGVQTDNFLANPGAVEDWLSRNIKLADLSQVVPSDDPILQEPSKCQGLTTRAPEVWEGHPCTHASEVWAIGAVMLDLEKWGILGPARSPIEAYDAAWSLAKLMRLFPKWEDAPITGEAIGICGTARSIANIPDPPMDDGVENPLEVLGTNSLRLETSRIVNVSRALLVTILVTDPNKRPSARGALDSRQYRTLLDKPVGPMNLEQRYQLRSGN